VKLTNLNSLSINLGINSIGENGAKYLFEVFASLPNLSSLNIILLSNSLGDNGAKNISEGM
jgi:hypothetical protein